MIVLINRILDFNKQNKYMKNQMIMLIALSMVCLQSMADGVSFIASAPSSIVEGEQFRLSYTITTQKVNNFRAPSINGFDVLMGPSRSEQSSTQIINGHVSSSSSITFTYILVGNKAGRFSISGASIEANGKKIISNAVSIKVLPPDQSSSGNSRNSNRASSSSSSVSSSDLFVVGTTSKTTVREQEALVLTYKIYTREPNLQLNNVKLPDFKGFHSQEIEMPTNAKWTQEHYHGRNYYSVIYRQFVLSPQQTGNLFINPAHFEVSIGKRVQSSDPFDAFFNGGSNVVEVKRSLSTPKITINVKSLPSGKPVDYSGGVGTFNITSTINGEKYKTNDAVTVKIIISGTGNLKLVSDPKIDFPKDFEVYDPKDVYNVRLTNQGLTGNKVIEYLAIPRYAGTFKIPGVTFSYYDIHSNSYKTLKTKDYEIQVKQGAGNAAQVIADYNNKEDLKVLGNDIRYIKLNSVKLQPRGQFFFGSILYWLFFIVPTIVFIIFFIIYRKQAIENTNVAKIRNKKASKVAQKRMKVASALLEKKKEEEFYDEVLKTLWGYISDKLNIPVSQLSKDNIEEKLKDYKVSEELIKGFINNLNNCEFARFAPSDQKLTMDKIYSSAIDIISKMEGSIKH